MKQDWKLSDYPISVREHEIDTSYVGTRLKQHRYTAQIVNWWVISGGGNTQLEALQELQKRFATVTAEKAKDGKKLPRPGTHVEIEFASRDRVDAHAELAEDFIRRVLNLDWAFVSDESSLRDFHSSDDNHDLIAKINVVYGVDVSDIESASFGRFWIAPPAGWKIGDKTGSGERGTTNVLAIIWPPHEAPVLVSVYLTGALPDSARRNEIIAAVGRSVAAMR
ncbi:MAG TPA: hypothetical protein VIH75_19080 [Candidatus Sulfotelmatobacter sp.]